jgi:Gram-negative bacterial TonB protein C-terminal
MRVSPLAIFALLASCCSCIAQQEPCGLRTMTETTKPIYPPIAKAAHVEGVVVMLVTFKLSGEVEKIDVINGPRMLQTAARNYVQGWHANEFTGPRTCPIAITFHLLREKDSATPGSVRQDVQHVTLNSPTPLVNTSYSYSTQGSN